MAIYEDRTVARGAQNIGSIIKMWGVSQHLGRKRQATEAVLGAVMEDDPEQLRTAVGTALQFGSAGIEALNETAFPLYEMMNRQKRNNAYIQNQQRQSEQRRFRDTTNAYGETVSALESEMKRFVDPLKNKIDEEAASKDSQIIKLRGARDVFLNGMLAPSAEVLNGGGGGLTGGEQSVVPREVGAGQPVARSQQLFDTSRGVGEIQPGFENQFPVFSGNEDQTSLDSDTNFPIVPEVVSLAADPLKSGSDVVSQKKDLTPLVRSFTSPSDKVSKKVGEERKTVLLAAADAVESGASIDKVRERLVRDHGETAGSILDQILSDDKRTRAKDDFKKKLNESLISQF